MIHQLFDFIQCSPTASHTAATVRAMLVQAGFTQLLESQPWDLQPGGRYYTTRGMSSLIAFQVPKADFHGFSVVAPHGDSPCFKVKESPELRVDGQYTKLNTEVYGGMQLALWTDRPLSVAGRLAVRTETGVKGVLCDIRRDLLLIPGVAIHMNRGVNEGVKLDTQKDTLPLLGGKRRRGPGGHPLLGPVPVQPGPGHGVRRGEGVPRRAPPGRFGVRVRSRQGFSGRGKPGECHSALPL